LVVTANVFPFPPIIFTLMMEAIISSEASILTTATLRHMPEHSIHIHRRENFKSYTALTDWSL
jgi:hypothetical protein